MYYEKNKNNNLGIFLIVFFLIIIIAILVNLINKIDANMNHEVEETVVTGTDTVLNDFSVENLVKNSIYSIVRNIKVKSK